MRKPVIFLAGAVIITIAMLVAPCVLAAVRPQEGPRPLSSQEHLVRGVKLGNAEDYDQALEEFAQAIALDPGCADAYYNRGVIHKRRGEWQRALQEFNRALAIQPQMVDALYERYSVHLALGHPAEAIADLEACLAIIQDIPDADKAHLEGLIREIKEGTSGP